MMLSLSILQPRPIPHRDGMLHSFVSVHRGAIEGSTHAFSRNAPENNSRLTPDYSYLKMTLLYKTKFHSTMQAMVATFASNGYTPCCARSEMHAVLNVALNANSTM